MFWENPVIQEALRTIAIAVLVALLGLLGYDTKVAKPRQERIIKSVNVYLQDDGRPKKKGERAVRLHNQR
jgi:hypothetical protein